VNWVESAAVRNGTAVVSLLVALGSLALFFGAGWAANELDGVSWLEASLALPAVVLTAVLALSLATQARLVYQRSLGRAGGLAVARVARGLGVVALVLTATAALALLVYAVLVWTDGLSRAPW
jgi:hypothetical protein